MRALVFFVLLALSMFACGGSTSGSVAAQVVLCPPGTVLDPQKNQCIAMEGIHPVIPDATAEAATVAASVTAPVAASVSVPSITPPPPPASGFAVDVRCTFASGWVTLLPASKYPKDDQFLMQSLIGLTQDPHFWTGAGYASLQPFAAKRCSGAAFTRLAAPTAGSYYLLAGEEGTFSARGTYDKNGVRRQLTVTATTSITLDTADLVHTWLCISCPWVVFRGEHGDLAPFVVLANRRTRALRGSDAHATRHVRVENGRIVLRVMEVEDETTYLESLALRIGALEVAPDATHRTLVLERDKEVTLTYAVPTLADGFVDVTVIATGYYDPK